METYLYLALAGILIGLLIWNIRNTQKLTLQKEDDKMIGERMDSLSQNLSTNLNAVTQNVLNQLNQVTKQVNERLKENSSQLDRQHRNVNERLDNAAKVVTSVTSKLSQLEESNKKIYEVGKDIASLQEILRAPKLRGGIGELFLGDLLAQILPKEHYSLQYTFKNGSKVDAVIHFRDKLLVPIDAKFPLENFKKMAEAEHEDAKKKARKVFLQDIKKHIEDIRNKYILPEENTLDFAFMYIPAENVYYETIIKDSDEKSLSSFAIQKKVIPVSPNTFFSYLQAILMGFKGLQLEKNTREILAYLSHLKTDFGKFEGDFTLLGTHLGRAKNTYDSSEKRLGKFNDKLDRIEALDQSPENSPKALPTKKEA